MLAAESQASHSRRLCRLGRDLQAESKAHKKRSTAFDDGYKKCRLNCGTYQKILIEYPSLAVIVVFAERPKSSTFEFLKISASP